MVTLRYSAIRAPIAASSVWAGSQVPGSGVMSSASHVAELRAKR